MAVSGFRASQLTALPQASIVKASLLPGKIIRGEVAIHCLSRGLLPSDRLVSMRAFSEIPRRNAYFLNTVLSNRCQSGDIRSARKLLEETPERNAISWNMVISALVRNGSLGEALDLYCAMRREGFLPTQFTFASVLSSCGGLGSMELGEGCHGLAIKVDLSVDTYCKDPSAAAKVFEGITLPNIVSFTVLMGALEQDGCATEAMRLLPKMANMGIQVDAVAVSSALVACTRSGEDGEVVSSGRITRASGYTFGRQLHALVIKLGYGSNVRVGNSLIDMYAKYDYIDEALEIFRALPEADVVSFNVLIAIYMRNGDPKTARRLSTTKRSTVPNDAAVECPTKPRDLRRHPQLLLREASLHLGQQVHAASTRMTLHLDLFLASGLVDLYFKCGRLDTARRVFDRMMERDIVSWNSMISGLSLSSRSGEAVEFFKQMRETGIVPTEYSYATIISACARLPSLSWGRQMHAQVAKNGLAGDVFCGIVEEARLLFDHMPVRNIVSWNEMILGYARNSDGGSALELFRSLLGTKENPNGVTFLALLTACSHSGLVDEGLGILHSMEREHGVEPLPITTPASRTPWASSWRRRVGESGCGEAYPPLPAQPSAYVLLSGIYASLGRWDGASAVRGLMNERGIGKGRGCSWTEGRNG
ncbi:unnamed protein product [Spirodela intermedia]|uniref:Uncharacterized protein n=1 Tax=Spirodela intermedia TaxID=51605 RepID=A0A7I8JNQ8_SPIIN|nr:unnamed protein product [Spirodela intermedia]CAA6671827.1 unnamed protein product [Spirodela intermedia]